MSFLKRFEVWLLLALSVGAIIWVFQTDSGEDGNPEPIAADAPAETGLKILRCTLERDYGNARLDIEMRYRNTSPRPLILLPPDVKLLTAEGKEIAPFILPVEKPAQVAAQTAQDIRLRYWLDKTHLKGPLTLEIRGEKAEVKGTAALDLETLENHKPKSWTGIIP